MKYYILLLVCGAFTMQSYAVETSTSSAVDQPYSSLWLSYKPLPQLLQNDYSTIIKSIYCPGASRILLNVKSELLAAVESMTGGRPNLSRSIDSDGTVLLGTAQELKSHLSIGLIAKAESLKDEGYVIESIIIQGKKSTVITSKSESGVLYGVFHFLRLMQTRQPIGSLSLSEDPAVDLRMLNHWDNLNRSIERGYAGRSLWKWDELPDKIDPRYNDYARFCASIGINAAAINSVNADSRILTDEYLRKVSVLAEIFRQWGVKVYLSANFAAPVNPSKGRGGIKKRGIGNLDTADPLDPLVQEWWKKKVEDIYALIPDFGGFVVKANSEGMPGPNTYGRSHVEGVNMFADVLKPHGGIVLWRAFVYGRGKDRAKDAYNEFQHFDGQFKNNAFLQIKNGPIDFQPREPFSPLFGAMPKTNLALELQIAKEYLGHATTLTYLAPMWIEALRSDTYSKGQGSTVAKIIDGTIDRRQRTCIAGVANTGDGFDWCGNVFNQANWYSFGRLAWNHQHNSEEIADEWIAMTFNCDAATQTTIKHMMLGSYEACVDYTMPLGLMHIFQRGSHYGPGPADYPGYHKADAKGLGVDRTVHGSNYSGQYHPRLQAVFNDIDTIPLKYLLWFHHVPWHHQLKSGRTLWDEMTFRYNRGVAYVDNMYDTWKTLDEKIDSSVHKSVMANLEEEKAYSRLWRKTCLCYFAEFKDKSKDTELNDQDDRQIP